MKRGLIIPYPGMKIHSSGSLTMDAGELETSDTHPVLLRQYVLYWDELGLPYSDRFDPGAIRGDEA